MAPICQKGHARPREAVSDFFAGIAEQEMGKKQREREKEMSPRGTTLRAWVFPSRRGREVKMYGKNRLISSGFFADKRN